mmetsp:Transcript_35229/g.79031  ORF Transcript_35229/g.79031 Transcript_35229/m.79031 type:complete len:82 (+) Transcript_35229:455-700(+)
MMVSFAEQPAHFVGTIDTVMVPLGLLPWGSPTVTLQTGHFDELRKLLAMHELWKTWPHFRRATQRPLLSGSMHMTQSSFML